jgi:hypothetical protein
MYFTTIENQFRLLAVAHRKRLNGYSCLAIGQIRDEPQTVLKFLHLY